MQHGRRPPLSQKSIAFMRAQLGYEPAGAYTKPIMPSLLQVLVRTFTWLAIAAFLFLLSSAPIVLLLWLFTPYNWTVAWLTCLCLSVGCLLLALLPDAAHRAPWKTSVYTVVVSLFGCAAYVVLYVPQHMPLADIGLGLAFGIAAAVAGYDCTLPANWSPVKAAVWALLSMTCFVSAGLALAYYVLPYTSAYEPVIPRFVLWGTYFVCSDLPVRRG